MRKRIKVVGSLLPGQEGPLTCADDWKIIDMNTGENLLDKIPITSMKIEMGVCDNVLSTLSLTAEISALDVEGLQVLQDLEVKMNLPASDGSVKS